jgi:hypothetical protein
VADLETGAVAENRGGDDQRDHGSKVYVVPAGVDPAEDRGGFAGQHKPNEEGVLREDQQSDQHIHESGRGGQQMIDYAAHGRVHPDACRTDRYRHPC